MPGGDVLDRSVVWFAWGGVAGVVVFDLGWLLAEAVQTGGYSVARHDVSDLSALTAQHAWVVLYTSSAYPQDVIERGHWRVVSQRKFRGNILVF